MKYPITTVNKTAKNTHPVISAASSQLVSALGGLTRGLVGCSDLVLFTLESTHNTDITTLNAAYVNEASSGKIKATNQVRQQTVSNKLQTHLFRQQSSGVTVTFL